MRSILVPVLCCAAFSLLAPLRAQDLDPADFPAPAESGAGGSGGEAPAAPEPDPVLLAQMVGAAAVFDAPEAYLSEGSFIAGDRYEYRAGTGRFTLESLTERLTAAAAGAAGPEVLFVFRLTGQRVLSAALRLVDGAWELYAYRFRQDRGTAPALLYEFDPEGTASAVYRYGYTVDGRLRTIATYDGTRTRLEAEQLFRWDGERIVEERTIVGDRTTVRVFAADGKLSELRILAGGEVIERYRYEYEPGISHPMRTVSETGDDPDNLLVTETDYDESARISRRVESRGGTVLSAIEYFYDGDSDRVLEQIETAGRSIRRSVFGYSQEEGFEDTMVWTEFYTDDVLVQRNDIDGTDRIERYYRAGREVLRIYFSDEIRVREEEILNGRVIRTRSYPAAGDRGTR